MAAILKFGLAVANTPLFKSKGMYIYCKNNNMICHTLKHFIKDTLISGILVEH